MAERRTFAFSIDAPECQKCKHYNDCKNKRMVACAYLEPIIQPCTTTVYAPLMQDMLVKHDYRNVKVGENTTFTIDLEKMKKKINEDFYKAINKSINCAF